MKSTFVCLLALLALGTCFVVKNPFIEQNLDEKCCVSCSLPEIKYYVMRNAKCGEACIDPVNYNKIKIFEPTLTKAESNTPCPDKHYSVYNNTETHGAGSLKVSLDMFLEG